MKDGSNVEEGDAMDVIETLRRQRAAFNDAIVGRNLDRIAALLTSDYTVLPGSIGTPLSKGQLLSLFAEAFEDEGFDRYERHADQIDLSNSGKRAAENGRWVGLWRKADGLMSVSGRYQAVWVPRQGSWKLLNESYVTLHCTGSKECAAVD